MAGVKPTFNQRPSLCPPVGNRGSPNAAMVDASNVEISIRNHWRQRDQETSTVKEHEEQLDNQRPSLLHAKEIIDHWKKRDSTNDSKNIQTNNDQIKK
jgi:hypothetical protein